MGKTTRRASRQKCHKTTRVKNLRDQMLGQRAYEPRVKASKSAAPGRLAARKSLRKGEYD